MRRPQDNTPKGIPRRANRVHALAQYMANRSMSLRALRQSASDRIGYAVACVIGAAAYHFGGRYAVLALVALYALSARHSWRKFQAERAKR